MSARRSLAFTIAFGGFARSAQAVAETLCRPQIAVGNVQFSKS